MPSATTYISQVSDANAPAGGVPQIIDPSGGARINLRPLDYTISPNPTAAVLGHYRAITFSGACNTITAGLILASLRWADPSRLFVLTRLAMAIEVLTAITAAPVFDAQAFIFRGSTGNASGSGSSVLTMTGANQKTRASMGSSLFATSGEIRTLGTTTALTACAGKTNDAAPFGSAFWGCLYNTTATGTAVLVSPGAALSPQGWNDLYSLNSLYQHPEVLVANEGVEVQVITANNTSGTVKYAFLWEWAEANTF
jgi:hypothetical protein